ncbi:hypothetical protein WME79_30345 [Sorangium sp. So ce726]|uniref:hypothetical protein n=1 Tax=Sorangium sp. So ce726 TaxID=3133319 RepID=UPI003F5F9774
MLHPRWLAAVVVLAGALTGGDAWAEVQRLRIAYEAHDGCPDAAAFLREVTARTDLARAAAADEAALDVRVRITSSGGRSRGRITLGRGEDARVREVDGSTCGEVVAALALITALRVDPTASLDPQPPAVGPRSSEAPDAGGAPAPAVDPAAAPPPAADPTAPAQPAGAAQSAEAGVPGGAAPGAGSPPQLPAPPPAALPAPAARPATAPIRLPSPVAGASRSPQPRWPVERPWTLGVQGSAASGVAPEALLGGGPFVELRADLGLGAAFRVAAEVAATGEVDAGPGGARFVRGIGRLDACADLFRPARRLSLGPCVGAEGGFLHGSGLVGEAISDVEEGTVPWASLGLLARVTASLGSLVRVDAQGGPEFPLVRRSFVFEHPAQLIHEVPAVTWTLRVGAGLSL